MKNFKWKSCFSLLVLLFTSSSITAKAETINYKFIWPEGTTTLHQKIDIACRQFGCNADQLKRVANCESTDNPKIVNWTEPGRPSGLFQHKAIYWQARTVKYGIPNADIFDADAQIYITAQMFPEFSYLWSCK
jgi:hypothetical protein